MISHTLKPVVIITNSGLAKLREGLKNITPLFIQKDGGLEPLYENLRKVGKMTGREIPADQAIKKFQAKSDAYKAETPKNKAVFLAYYYDVEMNPLWKELEKTVMLLSA
jgi:ABC-type Fe3+-hydroxamate transport system substrate-binding protein